VKIKIFFLFSIFIFSCLHSQEEKKITVKESKRQNLLKDPLTPSKAAFYSAAVPGLGQIYTQRYWTIPFIYGGLTVSAYFFIYQTNEMNSYRNAYKQRVRGDFSDEYTRKILFNDQLIEGMNFHKNYRDLSILWFVGIYLLNVLDANVGAHLLQFNVESKLSIKPFFNKTELNTQPVAGVNINLKF
tara:strand:- start:91 stop:648 length:558 start_codon:yes stop_codon:yes gene_type:complete